MLFYGRADAGRHGWAHARPTVGGAAISLIVFAVAFFAPAFRWLFPRQEAQSVLLKVGIALAGYVVAKIHLKWIDERFLAHGRLSRLLGR
jgi:hypothetical protein